MKHIKLKQLLTRVNTIRSKTSSGRAYYQQKRKIVVQSTAYPDGSRVRYEH